MTDLTDRMRTCAAALLATDFSAYRIYENVEADRVVKDAADLLIEASNVIEAVPPPLGEPMAIIPPLPAPSAPPAPSKTIGQAADLHACPRCDSRAAKTARRDGRRLMLICPVCATAWPWKPKAEWR